MFELKSNTYPTMGLRKHYIDAINLNKNKDLNPAYVSKADKFRNNTSNLESGFNEAVFATIKKKLYNQSQAFKERYDEADIYGKLLEKLEKNSGDFDPDKFNINDIFVIICKHIDWSLKDLKTELNNELRYNHKVVSYMDESDQKDAGDGDAFPTTDAILYQSGNLGSEFDFDDYSVQQAKMDIVEAFEVFSMYNKTQFISSRHSVVYSTLKILQHDAAYTKFEEEFKEVKRMTNVLGKIDSIVKLTTSRDFSGSVGTNPKAYAKRSIELNLVKDILENRNLYKTMIKLIKALEYLGIDIIWLDADLVLEPDYIKKLKETLYDDSVVFVSEEDLTPLNFDITLDDYKISKIKDSLTEMGIKPENIPVVFNEENLNKIKAIKASQLRSINTLTKKIYTGYEESSSSYRDAKKIEQDKQDMLTKTHEYAERKRRVEYSTLFSIPKLTTKNEKIIVPGVFYENYLVKIKEKADRYIDSLFDKEGGYEHYKEIQNRVHTLLLMYKDEEGNTPEINYDSNGFAYYYAKDAVGNEYRRYITLEMDAFNLTPSGFLMNKWLINREGYVINKFVDGNLREGKETEYVSYNETEEMDGLIMKDTLGVEIFNGPLLYKKANNQK